MSKFDVTFTQCKSVVVSVEADDSDKAVHAARKLLGEPENQFKNRIGAVVTAGVREIKDGSVSGSN